MPERDGWSGNAAGSGVLLDSRRSGPMLLPALRTTRATTHSEGVRMLRARRPLLRLFGLLTLLILVFAACGDDNNSTSAGGTTGGTTGGSSTTTVELAYVGPLTGD